MTKKDYTALALALKAAMPRYAGDKDHAHYAQHCDEYGQWCRDVNAVLVVCAKDNPAFSKGRFIAACGVPNILDK